MRFAQSCTTRVGLPHVRLDLYILSRKKKEAYSSPLDTWADSTCIPEDLPRARCFLQAILFYSRLSKKRSSSSSAASTVATGRPFSARTLGLTLIFSAVNCTLPRRSNQSVAFLVSVCCKHTSTVAGCFAREAGAEGLVDEMGLEPNILSSQSSLESWLCCPI